MPHHSHHHHSHNHHPQDAEGNILFAFLLNLLFAVIEVVGGLFTNSVAILSDALHDFGDCFSLGFAWFFQRISKRGRDERYSYGYRRFALVGAMINTVVLFAGSLFVVVESVQRLIRPEEADARGMFILAVFGVAINGIAMLRLRRGRSLNERTVSLHLLEDALGWIAVMVGSAVMMVVDFPALDPLMSLGIAAFILLNIYRNLRQLFRVILQGAPTTLSAADVQTAIMQVEGVESIHDLHIWSMDGEYNILSAHIVVQPNLSINRTAQLKLEVKRKLSDLNIHHSTLETENGPEDCDYINSCCT
ncbi:MAG: cation diffusion facilitator family transporter [Tannerellaceae bacterium]|jgi:cobalt-zinc-cadmium efflux system protein|nr:cation diffusion facilitator family transporter [Tannerellaceae bacterium]